MADEDRNLEIARRDQERLVGEQNARVNLEKTIAAPRYFVVYYRWEEGKIVREHDVRNFLDGDLGIVVRETQALVSEMIRSKKKEPGKDDNHHADN